MKLKFSEVAKTGFASKLAPLPSMKKINPRLLAGVNAAVDLAERAGFEPAIPFRVYTLSRRAPSTTRTPLLCVTLGHRRA
jgi:hypothetical protein